MEDISSMKIYWHLLYVTVINERLSAISIFYLRYITKVQSFVALFFPSIITYSERIEMNNTLINFPYTGKKGTIRLLALLMYRPDYGKFLIHKMNDASCPLQKCYVPFSISCMSIDVNNELISCLFRGKKGII